MEGFDLFSYYCFQTVKLNELSIFITLLYHRRLNFYFDNLQKMMNIKKGA